MSDDECMYDDDEEYDLVRSPSNIRSLIVFHIAHEQILNI